MLSYTTTTTCLLATSLVPLVSLAHLPTDTMAYLCLFLTPHELHRTILPLNKYHRNKMARRYWGLKKTLSLDHRSHSSMVRSIFSTLGQTGIAQPPMGVHIHFKKMERVRFHESIVDPIEMTSILAHAPSLRELDICHALNMPGHYISSTGDGARPFPPLSKLETLRLIAPQRLNTYHAREYTVKLLQASPNIKHLQFKWSDDPTTCHGPNCNNRSTIGHLACGRCGSTHYCSNACQTAAYDTHRHVCVPSMDITYNMRSGWYSFLAHVSHTIAKMRHLESLYMSPLLNLLSLSQIQHIIGGSEDSPGCRALKSVVLEGFHNLDDSTLQHLSTLPCITHINVSSCQRVTSAGVKTMVSSIGSTMVDLNLFKCHGVAEDVLVDVLISAPNLTRFNAAFGLWRSESILRPMPLNILDKALIILRARVTIRGEVALKTLLVIGSALVNYTRYIDMFAAIGIELVIIT